MSNHSYFSNQSQRYSSVAAVPSQAASNGTTNGNGGGAEPSQTRPSRGQSAGARSRLSLSVANNEKDGNGISGIVNGADSKTVHLLRTTWVFWYRQQRSGKVVNYEEGIKKIAPFSSIENFWTLWTHLSPPSTLPPTTDYILFNHDVKRPVWEDPLNVNGGKWIIRLRKGVSDHIWEDLVLALIGDQFDERDHVCGCVLSVRSQEDIVSVWHRDEKDTAAKARIKETIQQCLRLSASTTLEYKTNNDSLQDKSSFRTQAASAEKDSTSTEKTNA